MFSSTLSVSLQISQLYTYSKCAVYMPSPILRARENSVLPIEVTFVVMVSTIEMVAIWLGLGEKMT